MVFLNQIIKHHSELAMKTKQPTKKMYEHKNKCLKMMGQGIKEEITKLNTRR